MEKRKETIEINLSQCFGILLKKCYWIIACALICALAGFLYTWKFAVPHYQSGIKLNVTVADRAESNGVVVELNSPQSLNSARNVVDSILVLLQSNTVNEMVYNAAKEDRPDLMEGVWGPAAIGGMVSASALNETEIFQVVVTDTVPARAELIAKTISEEFPNFVKEKMKNTELKVVDDASLAAPVSLGFTRNVVIGIFAGVVISSAFILWRAFSNPFVQSEETVTALYGFPVLAVIPNLAEPHDSQNYSYNYYSYRQQSKKKTDNASNTDAQ